MRVGDYIPLVLQGLTTPHQCLRTLLFGRDFDYPLLRQGFALKCTENRRGFLFASGNDEGCLGQAIAGIKGFSTEAAALESRCETLQSGGTNRLSAVKCYLPTAQVEGCALFGTDPANAKVVGEIRSPAGGGAVTGDGLEPIERSLQKRHWRHQRARKSCIEGLQHPADQPHVVVRR